MENSEYLHSEILVAAAVEHLRLQGWCQDVRYQWHHERKHRFPPLWQLQSLVLEVSRQSSRYVWRFLCHPPERESRRFVSPPASADSPELDCQFDWADFLLKNINI